MSERAAVITPAAPESEGPRAVGSDELAQGLLLVRASAMKVVRLQLAIERQDRRVALETVDDLMLLDRRIGAFLDDLPVVDDRVAAARRQLDAQGRALAREKFVLAAGTSGPRLEPGYDPWSRVSAAPAPEPVAPEAAARRTFSSHFIAAILMLAIFAAAAAGFLLFTLAGNDLVARLPSPPSFLSLQGVW